MTNNKLFWPIILVTVVVIFESIWLFTSGVLGGKKSADLKPVLTTTPVAEKAVAFDWIMGEEPILVMKAYKDVAIDAIDLYIGDKGNKVLKIANVGDLPKPSFQKISTEKFLVVANYLISDADGLKLKAGQEIQIMKLTMKSGVKNYELNIDVKTQVVENGSAKVLPFNSKNLIINNGL